MRRLQAEFGRGDVYDLLRGAQLFCMQESAPQDFDRAAALLKNAGCETQDEWREGESRFACLLGVLKRVLTTYGKVRPDMGEGCPERMDLDFLKWVWNYNKEKREPNYSLLNEAIHAQTIVLKNRRSVRRFLKSV